MKENNAKDKQPSAYQARIRDCVLLYIKTYDQKTVDLMVQAQKQFEAEMREVAEKYETPYEIVFKDVCAVFNKEYYEKDWRHESEK